NTMSQLRTACAVAVISLCAASSAQAEMLLYDSGPPDGNYGFYPIYGGYPAASTSFELGTPANLTHLQVGLILNSPPDAEADLYNLQWFVGTTPGGSDVGFGTATPTNVFDSIWYSVDSNGVTHYDMPNYIYQSTFAVELSAASGTYYLTLQNALSP